MQGRTAGQSLFVLGLMLLGLLAHPAAATVKPRAAHRIATSASAARAPGPAVRPRALTPAELGRRGLLGRFKDFDPDILDSVWKPGSDPRTCETAWTIGRARNNAIPFLIGFIAKNETSTDGGFGFLEGYELAISQAMEAQGRYNEADRFLRSRIAVRVADNDGKEAVSRRQSLWVRVAELYAPTRPVEAERILNGLVAEREAVAAKTFAEFRNQPKDGRTWAYGKAWYDFTVLAARFNLLRPFYVQTGRLEEAAGIVREMAALVDSKSQLMTSTGYGYSQLNAGISLPTELTTLRRQIALRDNRDAEAEALLRDCCGDSPELARLLLREGKRDEARVVLSRRMLEVSDELWELIPCLRVAASPATDAAIAKAREEGEDVAVGSPSWQWNNENVDKQLRLLLDSGEALEHAVDLGEMLVDAGLPDDAHDVLRPTGGLAQIALGPSHPVTLRALAAAARAERLRGEPGAAVTMWAAWRMRSGAFLRDQLWRVSEDDRRRFFRDDRRNVDSNFAALREARPADAGVQALALSLRHKGLLAGVAGEASARARARGDAKTAAMLAQLGRLRAQFAGFALHNRAGAPEAALVRRQMSELEAQLAASLGPPVEGESTLEAPPQAILAALRPGEALVDVLIFADPDTGDGPGRERMAAVVARQGAAPTVVWWADAAPVRAAAARFRTAAITLGGDRQGEIAASGKVLYDLLWKPLRAPLGDATRILLAPDDVLNVTPLAALPDETGKPLVERYQLSMLSAPRDLLAGAPSGRRSAALVLGSPAFGSPPGTAAARGEGRVLGLRIDQIHFSPLPGTLEESRQVSAVLPGSRLLGGDGATKAAVEAARSPSILHLATHGFFLTGLAGSPEEGDPLVSLSRSGVALANANFGIQATSADGETQGILTALEATSLDLRDTRLVVLSACETGLGEVASGEGVYGLAQALHEAGARDVLATLWPVDDKATAVFMQRFYARLNAGEDPQVALRTVQRGFVAEGPWRDPVYWAPFVITGH